MKVFELIKNKKWSGRGFEIQGNSIIIKKSAKFSHAIHLSKGNFSVKVVGKRRSGSGKVTIQIVGNDNQILQSEDISFTSSSWTEHTFRFGTDHNVGHSEIRITRGGGEYGSIEIGRLFVDMENLPKPAATRFTPKNRSSKKLYNEALHVAPENKKIAFIIPYGIYGGAEVYLQNIINELDGLDISILYMKSNMLQNKLSDPSISHRVVGSMLKLKGILTLNNYDYIVYYNRADIYELLSDMKASSKLTSKIVEIYHSDFKWAGSLSQIKTRRNVDRFVSISESLAIDIDGLSDKSREVIPVGIDLVKFSKREPAMKQSLGFDLSKPIIGTVARLSKEKQLDYIIRLALRMPDVQFVIVGEGPERASLFGEIKRLKLDNVRLMGFRNDIHLIYNIFDAFILASRIEGTPISIMEAMASEVPVFTNMVGAIPDLIEDGVTGFKITEDPSLDCKIILNNMSDASVVSNARSHIRENHDVRKLSLRFLNSLLSISSLFRKKTSNKPFTLDGDWI